MYLGIRIAGLLGIWLSITTLSAADFTANEKAVMRTQVRTLCNKHDYRGAATYLMEHHAFPSRNVDPADYDDAQRWLVDTRTMLAGVNQIHGHLAKSGKRLAGRRLEQPLKNGQNLVGGQITAIADGRLQVEHNGRTHVVDMADLSVTDYHGLGHALLTGLGDRQGVPTQIALWQMLVGDATDTSAIGSHLKQGDHPLVPHLRRELLGYADAMRQAVAAASAPPVGAPPVGDGRTTITTTTRNADGSVTTRTTRTSSSSTTATTNRVEKDLSRKGPKPDDLAGLRSIRGPRDRKNNLTRYGASRDIVDAMERTLAWLAKLQQDDGSWDNNSKTDEHVTAMVLLVFLAEGQTPNFGKYEKEMEKALLWLSQRMLNTTSSYGCGGRSETHALVTHALAEAYVLTRSGLIYDAMEHGVEIMVNGQKPSGGYDYSYSDGDDDWYLQMTAWNIQALVAAKSAGSKNKGLDRALKNAATLLQGDALEGDGFRYADDYNYTYYDLTGVGTYCLQILGEGDSRTVSRTIDLIAKNSKERLDKYNDNKGTWRDAGRYFPYWFYDTNAMFMEGDNRWKAWWRDMEKCLLEYQERDGYWEFESGDGFGDDSGGAECILSTCYAALQLQVPYRYPPDYGELVKRGR